MTERWYKNAIIYAIDVEKFQDSDGDGIGDFKGLLKRLDYLSELGVNCIWLLPFYPSPMKDNGYDISDYYGVRTELGTAGDFVKLVKALNARGIKIISDLVVNHSSKEHKWFQASREKKYPRYDDYYIWRQGSPPEETEEPAFPGEQESVWTYDRKRSEYYYHTFYEHQPDLNLANPDVLEEIQQIIDFWVSLGVAGFRLDAAGHMTKGNGNGHTHHDVLKQIYRFASWNKGDVAIFAEADVEPHELSKYFADGNEVQVIFNFVMNAYLFTALAQEEAEPLMNGLNLLPNIPEECQWANFLRNLDELNLSKLPEPAKQKIFERFVVGSKSKIFKRGIRRRLAPLLNNNMPRIKMAYSLLFSLPGSPVIVYGDEIGMGDDLSKAGRASVRTTMQWSGKKNADFSDSGKLKVSVISKGEYGYKTVNVEKQRHDPDSLFSFLKSLIARRKSYSELSTGELEVRKSGNPKVFAHAVEKEGKKLLFLHNLCGEEEEVSADIALSRAREVLSDREYDSVRKIAGYGFRWFRID